MVTHEKFEQAIIHIILDRYIRLDAVRKIIHRKPFENKTVFGIIELRKTHRRGI